MTSEERELLKQRLLSQDATFNWNTAPLLTSKKRNQIISGAPNSNKFSKLLSLCYKYAELENDLFEQFSSNRSENSTMPYYGYKELAIPFLHFCHNSEAYDIISSGFSNHSVSSTYISKESKEVVYFEIETATCLPALKSAYAFYKESIPKILQNDFDAAEYFNGIFDIKALFPCSEFSLFARSKDFGTLNIGVFENSFSFNYTRDKTYTSKEILNHREQMFSGFAFKFLNDLRSNVNLSSYSTLYSPEYDGYVKIDLHKAPLSYMPNENDFNYNDYYGVVRPTIPNRVLDYWSDNRFDDLQKCYGIDLSSNKHQSLKRYGCLFDVEHGYFEIFLINTDKTLDFEEPKLHRGTKVGEFTLSSGYKHVSYQNTESVSEFVRAGISSGQLYSSNDFNIFLSINHNYPISQIKELCFASLYPRTYLKVSNLYFNKNDNSTYDVDLLEVSLQKSADLMLKLIESFYTSSPANFVSTKIITNKNEMRGYDSIVSFRKSSFNEYNDDSETSSYLQKEVTPWEESKYLNPLNTNVDLQSLNAYTSEIIKHNIDYSNWETPYRYADWNAFFSFAYENLTKSYTNHFYKYDFLLSTYLGEPQ